MAAQPQPQPQDEEEGVIEGFTNEGEGWLGECVGGVRNLTYTGGIAAGKAEGRGTVHCAGLGGWTLRDAAFRGGRMQPCRAVFAYDSGDAFAGPLAAGGAPADGARGAFVRGADGGRLQGSGPRPARATPVGARGAARRGTRAAAASGPWRSAGGRASPPTSASPAGPPGGRTRCWAALGVMERPTAQQVRPPLLPARAAPPPPPPSAAPAARDPVRSAVAAAARDRRRPPSRAGWTSPVLFDLIKF